MQKDLTSHLEQSLHANLIQALQMYSHLEEEQQEAHNTITPPISNVSPPPPINANAATTTSTDPAVLLY